MDLPDYAELHCLSHFSFQRGASSPKELVERALALDYRALAITDECSLAGVVRARQDRQIPMKLRPVHCRGASRPPSRGAAGRLHRG